MPGVQKPHCRPCSSQKPAWMGWSWSSLASPSIVRTSAPSAWTAKIVQDLTISPFTAIVQAPHWLVSQPMWVPVRPERVAQEVDEQQPGFDLPLASRAVDRHLDGSFHGSPLAEASSRCPIVDPQLGHLPARVPPKDCAVRAEVLRSGGRVDAPPLLRATTRLRGAQDDIRAVTWAPVQLKNWSASILTAGWRSRCPTAASGPSTCASPV